MDLDKESIREKLKRISKPDTTWIKKARKRAGIPEEGDETFTGGYDL